MRIVVTGCNGRVGSRVAVAALSAGHDVLGIDIAKTLPEAHPTQKVSEGKKFRYERADLRDFDQVMRLFKEHDAVVNLAGIPTPTDYLVDAHNTNVVISWNVLRAAAELGINRVALASSVNAVKGVFSQVPGFQYFPIDEGHPATPDEPYGLSKVIAELQASSIVQRYPALRVASMRLHWSIPHPQIARNTIPERAKNDLWGWVQEDSGADAFLRAVTAPDGAWEGHEVFYIVAPELADPAIDSKKLREEFWPNVPVKPGKDVSGRRGFYDCSKAKLLLGWQHSFDESVQAEGNDARWY
ncbi:NAD(P)-binding protein [Auriculariales sp. MPI-PUGE-AT-0066]|nr:NAD(P)-binding protein [Auriculariales sp. MPI-PUGE-AT-0066]